MMSELLEIDDPLLPRLREAAITSAEAHRWLLESARRWARAEFLRREEKREKTGLTLPNRKPHYLDQRIRNHYGRQVAVLIDWTRVQGLQPVDRIFVGVLRDDCTADYLSMWTGVDEPQAGLQRIVDLFELPSEWRTSRWPTNGDRLKVKTRADVIRGLQKQAHQTDAVQLDVDEMQVQNDRLPYMFPPLNTGDSVQITTRITMSQ